MYNRINNLSILKKNNIPIIIEFDKYLDIHDYPIHIRYERNEELGEIVKEINYGFSVGKAMTYYPIKKIRLYRMKKGGNN